MDLKQVIKGVTLTKVCSIKADKDSAESKSITLKVNFDGVPLQGVFDKAMSSTVIQWQNGPGRSKFDTWSDKQVVEIDFKSPAKTTVDPIAAIVAAAQAEGVSVEEYMKKELAKRSGAQVKLRKAEDK